MVDKNWFLYIVRTTKGALYTGITTDIVRRVKEHNNGTGSKAIKALGRPVSLVYFEKHPDRSIASKREYEIKQYSKRQKEILVYNHIYGSTYVLDA